MMVHEIKFDDRGVMQIYTLFHIVTGISTLIWQLDMLSCDKDNGMVLWINFKMFFPYFSVSFNVGPRLNYIIEAIPTCTDINV